MALVLRDIRLAGFFGGYAISQLGYGMTLLVLPLMLLQQTGSPALTGALVAVEATPSVWFGLFAEAVADRGRHLALLLGAELLATAGVGTAAVGWPRRLPGVGHLRLRRRHRDRHGVPGRGDVRRPAAPRRS